MSIDLTFVEQLLLEVFDDTHYTLSVIVPKKEEI